MLQSRKWTHVPIHALLSSPPPISTPAPCAPGPAPALPQHVDEQEGLYTFRRPDGGPIECSFTDGEMLLLSVEGKHVAGAGRGGWGSSGVWG